ncbi:hypothetical protein N0B16_11240 [Chryseobacterium sp. GMJ5]|uniref:Tetratricopeptide repeat protein n=1 Tax=Chryseobacterium gilvum TaxID=2976534 RepID=A0ABT2VYD9_9FLAO|nr:hypothetical protein [Chryseobacterium gilvum]MCU7615012.1 hypothetical protein [Chryseobacterium gilvum]
MRRTYYVFFALIFFQCINAQKKIFKCEKIHDAIELIDSGKYDEGITILKECEKIDPTDSTYPYEIAYAFVQKKEYKSAILQLEKIKNYNNIDDYYFSLLGNTYDYDGNPNKAISTYNEGLKKFPNSGRLHLEKGVVYEFDKPSEAMKIYEKGIQVDPSYPSNYYRAAKLSLDSENKLAGLIYGEIFMNLERTTKRTGEISQKLYETYKNSIDLNDKNNKNLAFCKLVNINPDMIGKGKLPFCTIFEMNFVLSLLDQSEFTLNALSDMREKFLKQYFTRDSKDYPNILLDYFKKMADNKIFNAYNHYIFQIGDQQAFSNWKKNNQAEYDKFEIWYTTDENIFKPDALIVTQIK